TGASVSVPSYTMPPDAPQPGVTDTIDTLDGRLTHAVAAIDPRHGTMTVWTQHTVAHGGTRAQVQWYEIDPVSHVQVQGGPIESTTLSIFNAMVSPDRAVSGSSAAFGDGMVASVNTSSASQFPAIQVTT